MSNLTCYLLVPMRFGTSMLPVAAEDFILIQKVLNRQFGGHTPLGPLRSPPGVPSGGQWVDPDTGETVIDECWQIKVGISQERVEVFRTVVRAIGDYLEQKAMYTEIGPPSVEILTVFNGDPKPQEQQRRLFDLADLLDDVVNPEDLEPPDHAVG